jgi:Na+:H+ antiporter, NhaA family
MSSATAESPRLDRPVDSQRDHVLGPADASLTLVEYGSYACPHCRAANERIIEVRGELGDRLRYAFRQRPIEGELARRAAELAESAGDEDAFWNAHAALMTRSPTLTEDDLRAVAGELGLDRLDAAEAAAAAERARARVDADVASARASGLRITPGFYIGGRRYDGPWDESSLTDALLGSLGHRVQAAALRFASWAPSTGVLLLAASVVAVVLANSPLAAAGERLWHTAFGLTLGGAGFEMSLLHWVNDGLLAIFFFVVGLEIKRELTVGRLAERRSAALPVAAAIGGMAVPSLLYALASPPGPWSMGWGVPMATDTAFAVALIAMLGKRVPIELRVFLTAAAIVDDLGAIAIVALVYSQHLRWGYLAAAAGVTLLLWLLNRSGVYRVSPYVTLGVLLWAFTYAGGLHATLAGVLLAVLIPTRPPPDYRTLIMQADTILTAEAAHGGEQLRYGPSEPALRALDAIHDRLESPADRLLRTVAPRASYVVLPLFALANAGVAVTAGVVQGREPLLFAIAAGLVLGKPLGFLLATGAAVGLKLAVKPAAFSWRQLAGAGALAGIGFTMSLFIAGQAFPAAGDFAAAKLAVFGASVVSAVLGVAILWNARSPAADAESAG